MNGGFVFKFSNRSVKVGVLYRDSTRNNTTIIALITMLTRPHPLIEAFVTNNAMTGFFAPNVYQFRAPFIAWSHWWGTCFIRLLNLSAYELNFPIEKSTTYFSIY